MKLKRILVILGVVVVLLAVAGLILVTHLGVIVKAGMESVGPKVTQTTLTVQSVDLSLFAGAAGVHGLLLGNPAGYEAPQSIAVSNAAVRLEPGSLLSDKVVIRSIEVFAPEITFEGSLYGSNNLTQIMANVKAMTGSASAANANAPAAEPAPKKAGKKLEVDDFLISGAKVHAHLTGLIKKDITLSLPDIHLTDLGKGNDGITAADLTQKVLSEITADTLESLGTAVAGLGKDALHGAQNLLQDNSTNGVGDSLNKLKQGIGGLFGK
jgi:hypothetical protein